MEKDLDIKLYNDYLEGEKGAFELLYNKYKDKIQYFVYNIVKDYQKAEDITQDVFVYVMQNKIKEGYTFKYYLYLVAKSRAYNQINMEKRRTEINEEYIFNGTEQVGQDVADIVTKNEKRKEILNAIDMLDDRYKNAIYLVKIEELSYQETAQILGESIQNVKNLIHRGKKELRKILLKKGFDEMNKVAKVFIIIMCVSVLLTGITYAGIVIYNEFIKKQDEVKSRGLFDLGDGHTEYEINLMANDMSWNSKNSLYHRIIDNRADYEVYKSRINEFPEAEEINFEENFVVIIANENIRQPHEKDLTIHNVYADDDTIHIVMKQKENPNYDVESNIWYAIVDKSLLRNSADVTIEQRTFNTREFKDIKDLPQDYSVENAITDGCIVLQNNKIISNNIEQLDNFVQNTQNNINSFIRVYSCYKGKNTDKTKVEIKDLEYYNGIYYLRGIYLNDEEKEYYNSYIPKLKKSHTTFGTEYNWNNDDSITGATFIIIQE